MVLETETLPLLEWLLGPNWRDGTLFQLLPLLLILAAATLGVVGLIIASRRGSIRAARFAGWATAVGSAPVSREMSASMFITL